MSIHIETYGSFRVGREKVITIEYSAEMTLRSIIETLNIDPHSSGIVKINDLTGPIENSLGEKISDGSCIQFLPYLVGG